MRAQLSVRGALVETRAQYVTTIRGLGRAAGVLLPTCSTENFVSRVRESALDDATRALIAPLLVLVEIERELAKVEHLLSKMAEGEPITRLLATAPGVGLIVACTFVSVIDEAKRFRNAQAVGAYLGLVPSEIIAIARKLAGVLWAMWRDGSAYDPVGQATASAKGTRKEARSKVAHAEALERAAKKLQRRAPRRDKTSEANVMT